MTPVEIDWTMTEEITISDHARELGFELRRYKNQKEDIQTAIKKLQ
ncbi:MAG: hypothetical protein M3T55_03095 [Pseudomonadota bacterium]|nr:hypothetical protein [Pseudomonadota bacterium]